MAESIRKANLRSIKFKLIAVGATKGFLLWYAIEKLFETKIGLSPAQIVAVGIVAQGSKVIFELPTSIVADRWSRRRILLVAQASMLICCVIAGASHTIMIYIIATLFWSLSDALTSGVYEAYAYDTIAWAGHKNEFSKIYTRMKSAELISMALAGIIAGLLSLVYGLRLSYFLSIFSVVFCSWYLLRLPETRLQGDGQAPHNGWFSHLGGALKTISGPQLRWPICIYILFLGFLSIWYEYYQLLGIDSHLSPVMFGSLISVLTLGMVTGSEIAHKIRSSRMTLVYIWAILLVTHLAFLRFKGAVAVIVTIFITFVSFMLLQMYLEIYIQTVIDSRHRATIFSLASTLGYAWFFLLAALFGITIKSIGIRWALTLSGTPLLLVGIIDIAKRSPWATLRPVSESLPDSVLER